MFLDQEAQMNLLSLRSVVFSTIEREQEGRRFSDFEFYFTRPAFLDIQATPTTKAKEALLEGVEIPSWVRTTKLTHVDPELGSEIEFNYDDTDSSFSVDAMNEFTLSFFESVQRREIPLGVIYGIETQYPEVGLSE